MQSVNRRWLNLALPGSVIALALVLVGSGLLAYGETSPGKLDMQAFGAWETVVDQQMNAEDIPLAIDGETALVEESGERFHRVLDRTIIDLAEGELRGFLLNLDVRFEGASIAVQYRDDPDDKLMVAVTSKHPAFASVYPKATSVPIVETQQPLHLRDGQWHNLTVAQSLDGTLAVYLDEQLILGCNVGEAQVSSGIRLWINTYGDPHITPDIRSILVLSPGDTDGSSADSQGTSSTTDLIGDDSIALSLEELGTAEKNPDTLRVMTYNILFGGIDQEDQGEVQRSIEAGTLWGADYAQRLAGIVDLLRYANADIVALQELMHWQLADSYIAEEVAQALGMNYVLCPQTKWDLPHGIFSRYEIIETEVLTSTWDGVGPPFMTKLALPDKSTLTVINLHSPTDGSGTEQLAELLTRFADERAIVLGDFNALPRYVSYELAGAGEWEHIAGHSVDLIYVSEALSSQSTEPLDMLEEMWEVVIPSISDQRNTDRNRLSDHLPQVMDVVLESSAAIEAPKDALVLYLELVATNATAAGASDGSIDLKAIGGVSPLAYSWTGPDGFAASTEDVSGLDAGTYEVTVTDATGREWKDTAGITACMCDDAGVCYRDILVTGAGTEYVNGTYRFAMLHPNGTPIFLSSDGCCRISQELGTWSIVSEDGFEYQGHNFYSLTPPLTWEVSSIGKRPAPRAVGGEPCVIADDATPSQAEEAPHEASSASAGLPGSLEVPLSSPVWVDEFDGSMDSSWVWLSPGDDTHSSLSERNGFLRIGAQAGGQEPPRGAAVLNAPAGDFIIETCVEFTPDENFERAGLLIYENQASFLVLNRGFCSFTNYDCVRNGIYFDSTLSTNGFGTETTEKNMAWLRMTKRGERVTGEYSEDGVSWENIGMHLLPSSSTLRVGVIADGVRGEPGEPAYFDYFRIESLP